MKRSLNVRAVFQPESNLRSTYKFLCLVMPCIRLKRSKSDWFLLLPDIILGNVRSEARHKKIQDIKHNTPFTIFVPSFTRENEIIPKNQIVAMVNKAPKIMTATKKSTQKNLDVTKTFHNEIKHCRDGPDIASAKLGRNNFIRHRTDLTDDNRPIRSSSYWARISTCKPKEKEVLKHLKTDVAELGTPARALSV